MAARENPTWIDSRQSPVWLKTSWKTPWNNGLMKSHDLDLETLLVDTAVDHVDTPVYTCVCIYIYIYIDDFKSVSAMPAMFDPIVTDDPNWLKIRAIVPWQPCWNALDHWDDQAAVVYHADRNFRWWKDQTEMHQNVGHRYPMFVFPHEHPRAFRMQSHLENLWFF